jgi:hypothetical protein
MMRVLIAAVKNIPVSTTGNVRTVNTKPFVFEHPLKTLIKIIFRNKKSNTRVRHSTQVSKPLKKISSTARIINTLRRIHPSTRQIFQIRLRIIIVRGSGIERILVYLGIIVPGIFLQKVLDQTFTLRQQSGIISDEGPLKQGN